MEMKRYVDSHVVENETDQILKVVWVICRAPGGTPEVVNLTGWGGEEAKK